MILRAHYESVFWVFTAKPESVQMLLQFIEHLEKSLYSAYEGTSGAIASQGKVKEALS